MSTLAPLSDMTPPPSAEVSLPAIVEFVTWTSGSLVPNIGAPSARIPPPLFARFPEIVES